MIVSAGFEVFRKWCPSGCISAPPTVSALMSADRRRSDAARRTDGGARDDEHGGQQAVPVRYGPDSPRRWAVTAPGLARWQAHFAEVLVSGDPGEVSAAAAAANAASAQGLPDGAANDAGRAAAQRYRQARGMAGAPGGGPRGASPTGGAAGSAYPPPGPPAGGRPGAGYPTAPGGPGPTTGTRTGFAPGAGAAGAGAAGAGWSTQLAERLFATPARWGWQAAGELEQVRPMTVNLPPRPTWTEPPRPDTSSVRRERTASVNRLLGRIGLVAVLVVAYTAFQLRIEDQVADLDQAAPKVYQAVLVVVGLAVVVSLLRAFGAVMFAARRLREFDQPFQATRQEQRQRYEQAVAQWDAAVRTHRAAEQSSRVRAGDPLWFPVHPASDPPRVDVLGGDPRRNGWASLLVTLGASVLARGYRITLLDLTGQDVGSGLLGVARARGLALDTLDLPEQATGVDLLADVSRGDLPETLSYPLADRAEPGDLRQERALTVEVLRRVIGCLDGRVTFGRLAAGVQVLRQLAPAPVLSAEEANRLAEQVGEVGHDEWTRQATALPGRPARRSGRGRPAPDPRRPLWTAAVSVLATTGGRDDRKELLDRLLVQLAQHAPAGPRADRRAAGRRRCRPAGCDRAGPAVRPCTAGGRTPGADDRPAAGRAGAAGRYRRRGVHHEDVQPPRRQPGRRLHRPRLQVRGQPAHPAGRQDLHGRWRGQLLGRYQPGHQRQARAVPGAWARHRPVRVARAHLDRGTQLVARRQPEQLPDQCPGVRVHRRTGADPGHAGDRVHPGRQHRPGSAGTDGDANPGISLLDRVSTTPRVESGR